MSPEDPVYLRWLALDRPQFDRLWSNRDTLKVEAIDFMADPDLGNRFANASAPWYLLDKQIETARLWSRQWDLGQYILSCQVQPKVVVLFDWIPPIPPLVPSNGAPHRHFHWWPTRIRSEKLVLNFHAVENPFMHTCRIEGILLPETVIVFHSSVPRQAPRPERRGLQTLPETLDSLLRTAEETQREHNAKMEAYHSWHRAEEAKITFVNCEVLSFPPPTSTYFEMRYLTLAEYRAEVGDQQFRLETDDTYTLPAQLASRLRPSVNAEMLGTET
jgi:hypothetical protein